MTNERFSRPRRKFLGHGAALGALAVTGASSFAQTIDLPIANGKRNLVAYPEKRPLIVLTSRPAQLETLGYLAAIAAMTGDDAGCQKFLDRADAAAPQSIVAYMTAAESLHPAWPFAWTQTLGDIAAQRLPLNPDPPQVLCQG